MLEEIEAALGDVRRKYGDSRRQYCQVEVAAEENGRVALSGAALDQQTREEVLLALTSAFPVLTFDNGDIKVLRQEPPTLLAVATNVTGLHVGPSFQAEMVSQLLNGRVVEQLQESGRWVFVRQEDGYLGWAYRPYLTDSAGPEPTHLVWQPVSVLRREPAGTAEPAGRAVGGMALPVTAERGEWAQVRLAGGLSGWLLRRDLRSLETLPADAESRRSRLVADSGLFTGVPYLWGGCTALGVDCSGYVQLLYRLIGVTLPRDADMQYDAGRPVEPPLQPGDLLFFGSERGHRAISHVGMSLGGWRIIHASRARNGVYVDDVETAGWLGDSYAGAGSFL